MNAVMSPAPVAAILEARDLRRDYPVSRGWMRGQATVQALAGVSFSVEAGRTLAVVGESGCGKSTLARLLTMIELPTSGQLLIDGADVVHADAALRRQLRRQIQIVFQNPYGSLNPRQTVGNALMEPLLVNGVSDAAEREAQARAMLRQVGLREEHFGRYPHMFSGGQRQRVAIARALMLKPRVLVLDEPVSALDVSIRAQVLNLLDDLQQALGVAYIFISHDLGVVRHVADEVMVMYLGRCVEQGPRDAVFDTPRHPYTQALLSATPTVDPAMRRERIILKGELPSPIDRPSGCPFRTRCPLAFARCAEVEPPLETRGSQQVACWAVTA
jgi:dipeptide transport system ATP-binding protein